ncbi:hypothetical protein BDQ12DRAFT_507598 [Crucibulum laeve]|uniref:Uncharacterized protein n=1 Tax=Crucibulum laeve TaxID=68775 RepID=A0A5C3MEW1_9AGAR|nr:hypothetical protein BDQ12DRAFT_507598 [Crucibulum laeve]
MNPTTIVQWSQASALLGIKYSTLWDILSIPAIWFSWCCIAFTIATLQQIWDISTSISNSIPELGRWFQFRSNGNQCPWCSFVFHADMRGILSRVYYVQGILEDVLSCYRECSSTGILQLPRPFSILNYQIQRA